MAALGDQAEDGEAPAVSKELARGLEEKQGVCTKEGNFQEEERSVALNAVARSSEMTMENCPVEKWFSAGG